MRLSGMLVTSKIFRENLVFRGKKRAEGFPCFFPLASSIVDRFFLVPPDLPSRVPGPRSPAKRGLLPVVSRQAPGGLGRVGAGDAASRRPASSGGADNPQDARDLLSSDVSSSESSAVRPPGLSRSILKPLQAKSSSPVSSLRSRPSGTGLIFTRTCISW
jgi:hypothetical protein